MVSALCARQVVGLKANTFVRRAGRQGVRAAPRRAITPRAEGPTWYPGSTTPEYLKGVPGSYGFDPLRLGINPNSLKWYQAAEKYHGRIAMVGVVGILVADLLGKTNWWEAGGEVDLPFGGLVPLLGIELAVWGIGIESFRFASWKKNQTMDGIGPLGTPFDPLGMASPETEVKEIKNGRLAMLAFLGFSSQAAVRGLGPVECLKLHLDNPGYNNIFTSAVGEEVTYAVVAASIIPMIIQARKTISPDGDKDTFNPIPGPWA